MKRIYIVLLTLILLTTTVYANPNRPYAQGYIEGYLVEISRDKVTIEEYGGIFHTLDIMVDAILEIDGIPVSHEAFRPGMEVYGTLRGRSIRVLEAYSTENPGYIPEGKKVRTGIVKDLSPNSISVKLPNGEEETYRVTPATMVFRKNSPISITKLYEGDRVRLFFHKYDTDLVSRIGVEGDSILVTGLYKGVLGSHDKFSNKIVLEKIKKFSNGRWLGYRELLTLDYSGDMDIYVGGEKIREENLKYYKGQEVYLAVKNVFGRDQIEKMTVKTNRERNYTEKIIDVNYYSNSFKLKNQINFSLNDGTIIVKNDRLVDKYSVNSQSDVFLVSDISSKPEVQLLYIYDEDINNSNIGQNKLYFGRLDEIIDYGILLRQYSILDRNTWDSYRGTTRLYYDNDTQIYNMEENRFISVEEFQAGNYAVDEDSSHANREGLKDWYGYLYTEGDQVLAIGLLKDREDLSSQRISAGTIFSKVTDPYVGEVAYLKDARDWSNRKSAFVPKSQDLRLMLEDAVIIKDDRLISIEELQVGDRLYIVRDDFICKFILVK